MLYILHAFDIQNYRQKCRFWKPSGARPPDQAPNNELFEGGLSDVLQGRQPAPPWRLLTPRRAVRARPGQAGYSGHTGPVGVTATADALRLSPSHHQSDKSLW